MQRSCPSLGEVSDGLEWRRGVVHTSLSSCDDIARLENSRDSVCLNRCWVGITTEIDVVDHDWMKSSGMELLKSAMDDERKVEEITSEIGAGRSSASATT